MNTLDSGVSTGSEIEEEGGGVSWGDRVSFFEGRLRDFVFEMPGVFIAGRTC